MSARGGAPVDAVRERHELVTQRPSAFGQRDAAGAPVVRVRRAGHEAVALHAVDRAHHRRLLDRDPSGELRLGHAVVAPQVHEYRPLADADVERPQLLAEPIRERPRRPVDEVAEALLDHEGPRTRRPVRPVLDAPGHRPTPLGTASGTRIVAVDVGRAQAGALDGEERGEGDLDGADVVGAPTG